MTNHAKTEIYRRRALVTQKNLRNDSTITNKIEILKILTFKNNRYMSLPDSLIILV